MRCKPIEGPRPYSSIYSSIRSARISSTRDFWSLCFAEARLPRPWTLQLCPMCRSSNLNQKCRQECHMLHCFIGILRWKLPHWSHVESIPIDLAKTPPSCFSIRTACSTAGTAATASRTIIQYYAVIHAISYNGISTVKANPLEPNRLKQFEHSGHEICFQVHLSGTWLEDMPNDLCSTCLSGHEVMESSLHHMYTMVVPVGLFERH